MNHASVCPDREALRRFLLGDVSDEKIEEMEHHLIQCPRCLDTVQGLEAADALVEALQAQPPTLSAGTDEQIEEMIRRLQDLHGEPANTDNRVDMPAWLPADSRIDAPAWDSLAEGASDPDSCMETYSFLEPPQQPEEMGRLGVYRVLGVLGSGGMGIVFRAEDSRLGRLVALKVLRPALIDSASARQRFLREARAAAAVEHEHVVHINDVGEEQRIPYVAMPLLQGESLEARIQREGRLAAAEVLRIGREVAEGLAAAHARGLVHRDIKPGNIWLEGERGRVKILDFGLARLAEDGGKVTRTGFVVGTPAFMAPEQAQGGTIDARTDLFSLGCMLYRLATGRLPFEGATSLQVLHVLISQEPTPPRQLNRQMPAALEQLIWRLLAKNPAQRPASAREVAETLAAIEAGEPAPMTPLAKRPPSGRAERPRKAQRPLVRKLTLAILLVVLLLLSFVYGPFLLRFVSNQGQLEIETDRDVLVVLHKDGQQVRILHAEQSRTFDVPAGDYHVEVREAPAGTLLSSYDFQLLRGGRAVLGATRAQDTREPASAETPTWPIIFSGVGKPANSVAFSPDGRRLAAAGNGKAMVWELATRKVSVVLEGERGCYTHVAFSPDSKQLAGSDVFSFIRVWDLSDGKAPTTKQVTAETKGLTWSPDGKRILSGTVRWRVGGATDTRGFVQAWDPDSGETTRIYSTELEQVPTNVAYSPDGRLVAANMFHWNPAKSVATLGDVRVWDTQTGSRLLTLHGSRTQAAGLAFSPDGKQLARGAAEGTVERWEVATGQSLPSLRSGTNNPCCASLSVPMAGGWPAREAMQPLPSGTWRPANPVSFCEIRRTHSTTSPTTPMAVSWPQPTPMEPCESGMSRDCWKPAALKKKRNLMSGARTDPEPPHRRKDDESRTLPLNSPAREVSSPAPTVGDTASFHPQQTSHPAADDPSGPAMHPVPLDLVNHSRYAILEYIGSGGMGTVYKARHRIMDRLVALKIISLDLPEADLFFGVTLNRCGERCDPLITELPWKPPTSKSNKSRFPLADRDRL